MSISYTQHHISSQAALQMVSLAVQEALQMEIEITACVVNTAGYVVAQLSTDRARFNTTEFAFNKAYTSVAFQSDTTKWYEKLKHNAQVMQGLSNRDSRIMVFPGGIPILSNGIFLGGIGISGGSAEQDQQIAHLALQAIGADI